MKHQYLKAAFPLLWLSIVTSELDEANDRALYYLEDSTGQEQRLDHLPEVESGLPSENLAFGHDENFGGGSDFFRNGGTVNGGFGGDDFDDFIAPDDNFVDDDMMGGDGGDFRRGPGFGDGTPTGLLTNGNRGPLGREPFRGGGGPTGGNFGGDDFDDFIGDDFVGDAGLDSPQEGGQFHTGASSGTPPAGLGFRDGSPTAAAPHSNDNRGPLERESSRRGAPTNGHFERDAFDDFIGDAGFDANQQRGQFHTGSSSGTPAAGLGFCDRNPTAAGPHSNDNRGQLGREPFRSGGGRSAGNFGGDHVDDFIGDDFVGDAGFYSPHEGAGQFRSGGSQGANPSPGFGDGKPVVFGPHIGPNHQHSFPAAPAMSAHHHHRTVSPPRQPHRHHNTNPQHHHHQVVAPASHHQHANSNPCGVRGGCGKQRSNVFFVDAPPLTVFPSGAGKGKRGRFVGGATYRSDGGSYYAGGGKAKGKSGGRAGFWF